MKHLREYSLYDGEWLVNHSKLCSAASSLDHPDSTKLSLYVNELCMSYVNQWQIVIDAYNELYELLVALNQHTDNTNEDVSFSYFDIQAIAVEGKVRDYSYLLIISMKSLLDLFSCLIDVVVTGKPPKNESQLSDFARIRNSPEVIGIPSLGEKLDQFHNYSWITTVKDVRNRLIHRGFRVRPVFTFRKSNELTIGLIKGNDISELNISITKIFDDFMADWSRR